MRLAAQFNGTPLSEWLNSASGRTFRVVVGAMFLIVGATFREEWWGLAMLVWSFVPLSSGAFDVSYISAALGGPFRGEDIRDQQVTEGEALPISPGRPSQWPTVPDR